MGAHRHFGNGLLEQFSPGCNEAIQFLPTVGPRTRYLPIDAVQDFIGFPRLPKELVRLRVEGPMEAVELLG